MKQAGEGLPGAESFPDRSQSTWPSGNLTQHLSALCPHLDQTLMSAVLGACVSMPAKTQRVATIACAPLATASFPAGRTARVSQPEPIHTSPRIRDTQVLLCVPGLFHLNLTHDRRKSLQAIPSKTCPWEMERCWGGSLLGALPQKAGLFHTASSGLPLPCSIFPSPTAPYRPDINECEEDGIECGPGQMCFNTRGSFQCVDTPCPTTYRQGSSPGTCFRRCSQDCSASGPSTLQYRLLPLPLGVRAHHDVARLAAFSEAGIPANRTELTVLEPDPRSPFALRQLRAGQGAVYTRRALTRSGGSRS